MLLTVRESVCAYHSRSGQLSTYNAQSHTMEPTFGQPLAVVIQSLPGWDTAQAAATLQNERPACIFLSVHTNPHHNQSVVSCDDSQCRVENIKIMQKQKMTEIKENCLWCVLLIQCATAWQNQSNCEEGSSNCVHYYWSVSVSEIQNLKKVSVFHDLERCGTREEWEQMLYFLKKKNTKCLWECSAKKAIFKS